MKLTLGVVLALMLSALVPVAWGHDCFQGDFAGSGMTQTECEAHNHEHWLGQDTSTWFLVHYWSTHSRSGGAIRLHQVLGTFAGLADCERAEKAVSVAVGYVNCTRSVP